MSARICTICRLAIGKGEGVMHAEEKVENADGFAFWKWDESVVAGAPRCLHGCHKTCMGAQVQEYMKKFDFGRLALPGASVVITRKKMAARGR